MHYQDQPPGTSVGQETTIWRVLYQDIKAGLMAAFGEMDGTSKAHGGVGDAEQDFSTRNARVCHHEVDERGHVMDEVHHGLGAWEAREACVVQTKSPPAGFIHCAPNERFGNPDAPLIRVLQFSHVLW